ncbi:MAG: histidinol-phosphate transaminase [Bacteroidales bacterium]|nr:histidinol-phosphate transaminase [Bacteroidales bacterium]
MSIVDKIIRNNIRDLVPYSSARDEYSGNDAIFLDANENPFFTGVNRYPDPNQAKLKVKIAQLNNISYERVFLGNGSDEAIDLLIRAFCEPGIDNVVSVRPTYGMYKVLANINNVEYRDILLKEDYQIDKEALLKLADLNSTLLFLSSPNNPTSNSFYHEDIVYILENFEGIVVLDEAYIDFSSERSFMDSLDNYPNLVILKTFSKAWGMAGIRLGMAFASREIIAILHKIKYPYNINKLTINFALQKLDEPEEKDKWVKLILEQRNILNLALMKLKLVKEILPSDANFLMVRFVNARDVYNYLIERKIILRDRSKIELCEGCLRVTVGTETENKTLLKTLQEYES